MTPARESTHLAQDLEQALDAAAVPHVSRRDVPRELLEPASEGELVRMALEEWAHDRGRVGRDGRGAMVALSGSVRSSSPAAFTRSASCSTMRRTCRFGGRPPAVRVVEVLCGYPIASTLNAMRYHHLRHHRDSGMHTDPYYKAGRQTVVWQTLNILRGLALPPFWSIRAIVGAIAYLVPQLRNIYAHVFLQDRTSDDLRESPEVVECARAEWGQVAFQALVVALAVRFPSAVLWGYVVPVSIAGLLAARRVLIEHTYERVADRQIETIIGTTNDNYLGVFGALGLAPRNIGYHIVHHIHPQVRLGALPRLREWYAHKHPQLYPPARR